MKVLGILGSPRVKGNTHLLLEAALKGAGENGAETETILADKIHVEPCREYYGCERDGNCVIRDDMDGIYPKLLAADVLLVASPIFFYAVPAQLKLIIDRCQALWVRKHRLEMPMGAPGRKAGLICVGATSGEKLFYSTLYTMKYFFDAVDADLNEKLLVRGVDERGAIKDHPEHLAAAYEMGKRLAPPAA
ncbi:flavodoxin family protein [Chloroflexota bacterium]